MNTNYKKQCEICQQVKIVLVDIEGTTTPISFVKKILFPYAKENTKSFLSLNYSSGETLSILEGLQEQCKSDCASDINDGSQFELANIRLHDSEKKAVIDSTVSYVMWLMENDRKVGSLKLLQGKIWKEAYKMGAIKGEVFKDVKPALEILRKAGKSIYVYSSGSVEAQKLLFGYNEQGDMLTLFDGNFDTEIGNKKVRQSYINIANELNVQTSEILFLTDVTDEADAALAAGCNVFIVCRPGNKPILNIDNYMTINNFMIFENFLQFDI